LDTAANPDRISTTNLPRACPPPTRQGHHEEKEMNDPWNTAPEDPLTRDAHAATHSNAPPMTGRRGFLVWTIHGLSALLGVVLAAPALAFLLSPLRRALAAGEGAANEHFTDVAKLSELPFDMPREFIVRQTTRDSWTLRPDQIVGRVFLIRRRGQALPEAFTTICPHLGCSVNFTGTTTPGATAFLCPCHSARYDIHGKRTDAESVAPRDMDPLPVRLKPADPTIVQVEYKRFYSNKDERKEVM
jgi:Rieske Fe-S protein